MKIKGILMGFCLSASIVALPGADEASACGDESVKDQIAPHAIQNKLPSKLGWSAEHPSKDEINTHLWLFNQAEKILAKDVTGAQLDLVRELKNYNKEIAQGIFDADHKNPYYDKNTFLSHFYNPKTHKTYIPGFPNAKDTGTKYFNISVEEYQDGNFEKAFYNLGLAIHYYTDVSQPMHANNFTALSHPVGYHCAYENYVDTFKQIFQASAESEAKWFCTDDVSEWYHENAKRAQADYPKIVNAIIKKSYIQGLSDSQKSRTWKKAVRAATGKRLRDSQETLAGFLEFWYAKTNE